MNNNKNNTLDNREKLVVNIIEEIKKAKPEALQQFFSLYSDDIYSFPIKFFHFTEDDAGDFYLYVFEHLKNGSRLSSFKGTSKFSTWFHSVLRNLSIDFIRTKKHNIELISYIKRDNDGNIIDAVEDIPDTREHNPLEVDNLDKINFDQLSNELANLKIENRIIFKLAYIYFFDLTVEEIKWISQERKILEAEVIQNIAHLKQIALDKVNHNQPLEDKITHLYQKISILQRLIYKKFQENPNYIMEEKKWSVSYFNANLPSDLNEDIQDLMKKKNKREQLLLESHHETSLKISYKDIVYLTGHKEGYLATQLSRITNKLTEKVLIHS